MPQPRSARPSLYQPSNFFGVIHRRKGELLQPGHRCAVGAWLPVGHPVGTVHIPLLQMPDPLHPWSLVTCPLQSRKELHVEVTIHVAVAVASS